MKTIMDDKGPPPGSRFDKLLDDLRAVGRVPRGEHVSEDLLIDYACDTLTSEDVERVEGHLATCAECSDLAIGLLDAAETWKGESGARRLSMLRERAREEGIGVRHVSRRELALYLADRSRVAVPVQEHIEHEKCATCLGELNSPTVRAMAHLATMPAGSESISAQWIARFSAGPVVSSSRIRASTGLAGSLRMPPSSLYFGGDRQSDGVEDLGLSFVSAPKAYAITGLLTANGRSLPEEADIFWGHEIWLIQLPWLMVPGRDGSGARSIGLSVRFPEQAVEIVDCLPRGSTPDQVTTVDVSWAGRIANPENDSALVEPDALRLDFDADIRLYTDATMLGRLTYSRSNTKVLSAVVGVAEALWVLQPPDPYMGAVGTMWLTAITDKHVARLNIEVRSWIEMTGLNNVPARLVAEPVTLEVTLVTEPK